MAVFMTAGGGLSTAKPEFNTDDTVIFCNVSLADPGQ